MCICLQQATPARLEDAFQYGCDTSKFVAISLGLRSKVDEPTCLAIVRTLTRHLKMQPCLCLILAIGILEVNFVVRVVVVKKILDYRTRLDKRDSIVWVLNRGQATVWVELDIWFFLDVGKVDKSSFTGNSQLLKDDSDLPRVGAIRVRVEDDRKHFE